jgi:Zn-dependent M16 (insulinase) family peptidase
VRKYLIDNNNYIVLRGANNPHIIEYENNRNRSLLIHMQKNLTSDRIQEITDYVSPNYLQDLGSLPSISPSELECFEDLPGEEEVIGKIRTVYNPRVQGNKFTFKFDLTDLGEEDIPILALFCKAFPQMGYKTMKK